MPHHRQIYVCSMSRRERSWGRARRRSAAWLAGSTTVALVLVGAALLSSLRV